MSFSFRLFFFVGKYFFNKLLRRRKLEGRSILVVRERRWGVSGRFVYDIGAFGMWIEILVEGCIY